MTTPPPFRPPVEAPPIEPTTTPPIRVSNRAHIRQRLRRIMTPEFGLPRFPMKLIILALLIVAVNGKLMRLSDMTLIEYVTHVLHLGVGSAEEGPSKPQPSGAVLAAQPASQPPERRVMTVPAADLTFESDTEARVDKERPLVVPNSAKPTPIVAEDVIPLNQTKLGSPKANRRPEVIHNKQKFARQIGGQNRAPVPVNTKKPSLTAEEIRELRMKRAQRQRQRRQPGGVVRSQFPNQGKTFSTRVDGAQVNLHRFPNGVRASILIKKSQ